MGGDKKGLLANALVGGAAFLQNTTSPAPSPSSLLQQTGRVTSDCKHRLNVFDEHHSACVVTRNNKALLVWVPYGSAPGWDLPGGRKHDGEAACETAEREVCEETGFQVRAVDKLAQNIFQCEIVAENVCTNPVDEGFLRKTWAVKEDLASLRYRGGTWGDKRGILASALRGSAPQPDWADACGCKMCHSEGFSTSLGQCSAVGKTTGTAEACACLRRGAAQGGPPQDVCGCKVCEGEGWSTTVGRCAKGSNTDPSEACECKHRSAAGLFAQVA